MNERVTIFVDGSNLYHSLQTEFGRVRLDFIKLATALCQDRTLVRTYYYNAVVRREDGEERYRNQQRFFESLRQLPYFDLRLGRLERRGNTVVEKGIDVQIAIDMLRFAYTNSYDTAILVSGDADYVPAVEAVKEAGKHVELACLRSARSHHLRQVVDQVIPLNDIIPGCWL
jgi:uncharacterized LabA/DUF88 family protein